MILKEGHDHYKYFSKDKEYRKDASFLVPFKLYHQVSTSLNTKSEEYHESFTDKSEHFTKMNPKCWVETLLPFRSSSLCLTCSGRSEIFFHEIKRAKVSEQTCKALLKNCYRPLTEIVLVSDLIDELTSISVTHVKEHWDHVSELKALRSEIEATKETFSSIGIKKLLSKYSSPKTRSDDVIKQLCQSFLRLSRSPFVIKFTRMLLLNYMQFNQVFNLVSEIMEYSSNFRFGIQTKRISKLFGDKKYSKKTELSVLSQISRNKAKFIAAKNYLRDSFIKEKKFLDKYLDAVEGSYLKKSNFRQRKLYFSSTPTTSFKLSQFLMPDIFMVQAPPSSWKYQSSEISIVASNNWSESGTMSLANSSLTFP